MQIYAQNEETRIKRNKNIEKCIKFPRNAKNIFLLDATFHKSNVRKDESRDRISGIEGGKGGNSNQVSGSNSNYVRVRIIHLPTLNCIIVYYNLNIVKYCVDFLTTVCEYSECLYDLHPPLSV